MRRDFCSCRLSLFVSFIVYFATENASAKSLSKLTAFVANRKCHTSHLQLPTSMTEGRRLDMIGTGFTFDDGEQILVSVQKPLGLLLEQVDEDAAIVVAEILDDNGSAAIAGVEPGDILLSIQNADMTEERIETALKMIADAPTVINLRFLRLL